MNLVIVESPTKARKLAGYLSKDFKVEASVGHVRDLPKNNLGVDIENDFEPVYEVSEDKLDVINKLTTLAKQSKVIYLATDPDREGEAIAWHIKQIIQDTSKTKHDFLRATFHEITKPAVLAAIEKPHKINMHLVDAQQARRVVDRLVGYEVSPVLWKKVRRGLSAGRVQSVALRLIVEREREIEKFKADEYWEVDVALITGRDHKTAAIFVDNKVVKELPEGVLVARVVEINGKKYEPSTAEMVEPVTTVLPTAEYVIKDIERKQRRRASLPPFTTSTLQQAAATRLGFTSKQTMRLAQQLYEEGLITYHRTDSVSLSEQAISMARAFIQEQYSSDYLPPQPRYFANKSKNAQEAHEAVRATDLQITKEGVQARSKKFSPQHAALYDLIWRRFIASQMQEAVYDQTAITIAFTPQQGVASKVKNGVAKTTGSILKFDGWMRLFPGGEDTILPEVQVEQKINYHEHAATQKFTQPPPRYNDASLVKELEKRGIGRPSTYASIISVIEDRGYVERLDKRFLATAIGMTVNDFLVEHFPEIVDYDFTAEMEEDLDRISRGEREWKMLVKRFYQPLSKKIKTVSKDAERVQIPVEKTGEMCPKCGETEKGEIVIRTGRFGRFKSCNRYPECDFTENIVEKVEGVTCPLCQEGDVIIKNSRWGKSFFGCSRYPECDWADWKAPAPGTKITKNEWAKRQAERRERAAKRKAKFDQENKAAGKKAGETTTSSRGRASAKTSKTKTKKTTKSKKTTGTKTKAATRQKKK